MTTLYRALPPFSGWRRAALLLVVAGLCLVLAPALARAQSAGSAPASTIEGPGLISRLTGWGSKPVGLDPVERVRITAPFIELHTGPGRGYPVFYVAEREAWITIELRHTDWYKVRTENGKLGWVQREQLSSTLTEAGGQKTFREVLLDDYLHRKVEMGAALGRFQSEPVIKLWGGYRLSDTLSLEASTSQVQGRYSGSSLWQVNLLSEPWFDQRFSPFFGIGVGRFNNVPNKSLVDITTTDANLANAVVGARYHLSDRFVLRADLTLYSVFVSDRSTQEFRSFTAGLSFFF
jgi:uncharacterized protein YgiM (DUF1202 family)